MHNVVEPLISCPFRLAFIRDVEITIFESVAHCEEYNLFPLLLQMAVALYALFKV